MMESSYIFILNNSVVYDENIQTSTLWEKFKENNMATVNRMYVRFMGATSA